MATHYVHNRARHSGVKYNSRLDGLRSAVRIYVCMKCGLWHYTKTERCGDSECGGRCQHFASRTEASRFAQLRLMLNCNYITDLALQPRFPVRIKGVLICTYIGDFQYRKNGKIVIEDTKGSNEHSNETSALRRRLAEVMYDMQVIIVEK